MKRKASTIDRLFPVVRRQVLATTLLDPERSWYLSELALAIQVTPSSLQRELQNLVEAGILSRRVNGNRTYFQADRTSPIFPELHSLMKKSMGIVEEIKNALRPLEDDIEVAFVYGSYTRPHDLTNFSDVDLMVVGDTTGLQLAGALAPVERAVGREINPTIYTRKEFDEKIRGGHHFLSSVLRTEIVPLLGNLDVLAKTSS